VRGELEGLALRPGKGRGQSFLRDQLVAARQVLAAAVGPGDEVLEIGGGLGILTAELARRRAKVRVLEIEPRLVDHLRSLRLEGVEVERADALSADLGRPEKVVANLPYSITTPLLERLLETGAPLLVLMVQLEVAKRLAASPGSKEWSRLGALCQRDYEVEIIEQVSPQAFYPPPKVRSAVVRFRRRVDVDPHGARRYRKLVEALFAARRRKVRNSVRAAAARFGADPESAARAADALGLADRRPEELSVAQFEALATALALQGTTK
jgi:16S rRNA (adenine1518-N6/adenine1519-N6)-dimethyltransferase